MKGGYDLVTNILDRTFPKGQSVEVIDSGIFCDAYEKFTKKGHFEHVTRFFYENSESFRILNITSDINLSDIQMSVDTPEDFRCISHLIRDLNPGDNCDFRQLAEKISPEAAGRP